MRLKKPRRKKRKKKKKMKVKLMSKARPQKITMSSKLRIKRKKTTDQTLRVLL